MGDGTAGRSLRVSFLVVTGSLSLLFLTLSLVQPVLPGPAGDVTGSVLSVTCHRLPSRCIDLPWGTSGLCARCTAFWAGITVGVAVILLTGKRLLPLVPAFALVLPMVLDGVLQQTGLYQSNLVLRSVTGFLCGTGIASVTASLSGRAGRETGRDPG
jgi:uncharacterized membrane protein